MRKPSLHPACKIFPPLGEAELAELANDIAANGLRNPIVLLKGKVLDGRNRLAACKIAKVKPKFIDFKGQDPIGWVVSQNLVRRHLTASQKAVVAFDLLPLLEKEAKERQRQSNLYRRTGQLAPDYANPEKGKAAEFAAKIAQSSTRYVEAVKAISKEAPEVIDRIRSGELNIAEARRLTTINQQRTKERQAHKKLKRKRDGQSQPSKMLSNVMQSSLTHHMASRKKSGSLRTWSRSQEIGVVVGQAAVPISSPSSGVRPISLKVVHGSTNHLPVIDSNKCRFGMPTTTRRIKTALA